MKEVNMDIEWRTVQMFLEDYGVVETEVDSDNNQKIRCTCPAFAKTAKCKHTKHIKDRMAENDGHYAIHVPIHVDEDEAFAAMGNSEKFREFVIKYGKVEVID